MFEVTSRAYRSQVGLVPGPCAVVCYASVLAPSSTNYYETLCHGFVQGYRAIFEFCFPPLPSVGLATSLRAMDILPDSHMRRIRNIDFCSQELETLLPHRQQKISGTTLDAFAAVVQDVAARSPTGRDFCLFSSWIPAIVSEHVPDGGHAGSIEDHLLAAVSYSMKSITYPCTYIVISVNMMIARMHALGRGGQFPSAVVIQPTGSSDGWTMPRSNTGSSIASPSSNQPPDGQCW